MQTDRLFMLLCLVAFGCGQQPLGPDDLRKALRDPRNGVFHELDRGNYHVSLQYVPIELLAAREAQHFLDERSRDSVIAQYGSGIHFLLEISRSGQDLTNAWIMEHGRGPEGPYLFSFGMKDNLSMEACGSELPALQCTYIRMFELARSSKFHLVFPSPSYDCTNVVVKLSAVLPELGPVSFQQSINAIRKMPPLRLD